MIIKYFREGQKAFHEGKTPETDNEYDPESEPYNSWEQGWYNEWWESGSGL
jgi:hypothetical protein